jgi:hypothetical protein
MKSNVVVTHITLADERVLGTRNWVFDAIRECAANELESRTDEQGCPTDGPPFGQRPRLSWWTSGHGHKGEAFGTAAIPSGMCGTAVPTRRPPCLLMRPEAVLGCLRSPTLGAEEQAVVLPRNIEGIDAQLRPIHQGLHICERGGVELLIHLHSKQYFAP